MKKISSTSVVLMVAVCSVVLFCGNLVVLVEGGGLCNIDEEGLMACKPAITAPQPSAPTKYCCDLLRKANLECLCSYKDSSMLPYLGIDPNLAMELPSKCGIAPPSMC